MEMDLYAAMDIKSKEKVLKNIDKSLEDLAKAVKKIKDWMEDQKHFPEKSSEAVIEFFITITDFDLEVTKEKMDYYYRIRTEMPEVYKLSYPFSTSMIDTLDFTQVYPLPKLVNESESCVLFRLKNATVPNGFDAMSWIAATLNTLEIIMQQSLVLNNNIIFDHKNLSLTHVYYITPKFIINCAAILEKVFCEKVKAMHIINHPSIVYIVLALCKPIIKPELYAKFRLHDSIESLSKDIPLDVLPKDYGGSEKSLEDLESAWKQKLYDYKDRFEQLQNLKLEPLEKKPVEGFLNSFSKLIFN